MVLHREVRAAVETAGVREAEDVDAVVGRDDDVALGSMDPVCGKLGWDVDTACVVAAAGPVQYNWEFGVGGGVGWRPDGEG